MGLLGPVMTRTVSYLAKFPLFSLITAAHTEAPVAPRPFTTPEIYIEMRFSSLARNVTLVLVSSVKYYTILLLGKQTLNTRFQNRK